MMRGPTRPLLWVATGAVGLAVAGAWALRHRSNFDAAWHAFQRPVAPAAPSPPLVDESPLAIDLSTELDRQLAKDFEAAHPDTVLTGDLALADALPDDLGIPITRRALRFVRFFAHDKKGRRAFEVLYRRSGGYRSRIELALRRQSLPADLVWLVGVESAFDPRATSAKGAAGLWQFIPSTARSYGLAVEPYLDERRHIDRSTEAAAGMLRDLADEFGRLDLALAAYNAGSRRIHKAMVELEEKRVERGEPALETTFAGLARAGLLPRETADYVPKIVAMAIVASNLDRFSLTHIAPDPAIESHALLVPGETKLTTIAQAANISVEALKRLNPELLRPRLPAGEDYAVSIPSEVYDRTSVTIGHYLDQEEKDAEIERRDPDEDPALAPLAAPVVAHTPNVRGHFFVIPSLDGHRPKVEPVADSPWARAPQPGLLALGQAPPVPVVTPSAAVPGPVPEAGKSLSELALAGEVKRALVPPKDIQLNSEARLVIQPVSSQRQVQIRITLGRGPEARRFAEVVKPSRVSLGLALALGRAALGLESSGPATRGALRARLNRHRRVVVNNMAHGRAWLTLADHLFPPTSPGYGRIIAPRRIDPIWWRDRLLLHRRAEQAPPPDRPSLVIHVEGAVKPESVETTARHLVARMGLGKKGRLPPPPTRADQPFITVEGRPALFFGWPLPGSESAERYAAEVALEIVAGHEKSKLAAERPRLLESYRVRVDLDPGTSAGVIAIEGRDMLRPSRLEARVHEFIEDLAARGPSRVELAYAAAGLRSRLRRRIRDESSLAITTEAVNGALGHERAEHAMAGYRRVKAIDVQRAASTWLKRTQCTTVASIPAEQKAADRIAGEPSGG